MKSKNKRTLLAELFSYWQGSVLIDAAPYIKDHIYDLIGPVVKGAQEYFFKNIIRLLDALKNKYGRRNFVAERLDPESLPDSVKDALESVILTLNTIAKINFKAIREPHNKRTPGKAGEEVSGRSPLFVYSTSYDCFLERTAAFSQSLHLLTRFSNAGNYTDNWHYRASNRLESVSDADIYLHHLYGCVAWAAEEKNTIEKSGSHTVTGKGSANWFNDHLKEVLHFRYYNGTEDADSIDNTVPSMNDTSSGEQYFRTIGIKNSYHEYTEHGQIFDAAMDSLVHKLHGCRTLIIWGYDFEDQDLCRQILNVFRLRRLHPFRILIVDPRQATNAGPLKRFTEAIEDVIGPDQTDGIYQVIRMQLGRESLERSTSSTRDYRTLTRQILDAINQRSG